MKVVFKLITIFFLFVSFHSNGQTNKEIKWGIMGSISNTNFNNIKPFSKLSLTGFKAGIYANRKINSKYEASLKLNYSKYGGRSFGSTRIIVPPAYDSTFYNNDVDIIHYINLYPGIKYYPNSLGNLKPFVGFGLFIGYLLKSTRYNLTVDDKVFNKLNQRDFFYKINYGVNVDVGLLIFIGKNKRAIETSLSYEPGLLNTGKGFAQNSGSQYFRTSSISFNMFCQLNEMN
jgi:hypothetical protein